MAAPRHVQTKREIESILRGAGISPRKRFGQHFLVDGNLMRRLVDSAELNADDVILEVGGGTGGLTDLLVACSRRVVCVEIDRGLLAFLKERFAGRADVTLVGGDVLENKHTIRKDVIDAIAEDSAGSAGAKLVANLPYQVATPLIMNLLLADARFQRLCFTVQAEVAERVTARHGCKAYGPLAVLVRTLCRTETIARVPPAAFWPRPAVDSAIIRMDVLEPPVVDGATMNVFSAMVRGVFDHRRKTLRSALGYIVDERARELVCGRFDGSRRPESFSPAEWLEIFRLSRQDGDPGTRTQDPS